MRAASNQPTEFDVREIFQAAHDAIDEKRNQDLWTQIVTESFVPGTWHDAQVEDGPYYWHASALCQCPREAILRRAGLATDGTRLESKSVFAIGTLYHALARFGMHVLAQYDDILSEVGGLHPSLPLAARADIVYRHEQDWYIAEMKTESEFAGKHRREEKTNGTSARHEHQIQVTAQAMVLEALGTTSRIDHAFVAYIAKESGNIDQQPVEITDALRQEVVQRLTDLEQWWSNAANDGILPPMLPDEEKKDRSGKKYMATAWQCRPRSDSDPRGLYCSARSTCFKLKEQGR